MKAVKYIVIALVILGTGIFLTLSYQQDKNRRIREEAEALDAAREAAVQFQQAIQEAARAAAEAEAMAREHLQKTAHAVQAVTGRPLTRHPEKKYLPTRVAPRAAPSAEEQKSEKQAAGREEDELPPGMLTKEQLERMRAAAMARQGITPKETQPDTAAPAPQPLPSQPLPGAEPEASPTPVPKEPEIVILARSVVFQAENVIAKSESLQGAHATATALAEQVALAGESKRATDQVARLKGLHAMTQAAQTEIRESMAVMQEPFQAIMEAEAAYTEEMARRETERARILKEEELRLLVQRELAAVGKAHSSVREYAKTYRWDPALAELKAGLDTLQSSEGRKAMAVLIERYEHMKGLHEFLIRRINVKRYRWGWGHGPAARDVIAANENVLQVTGQAIPWSDVGLVPMVRLLRYYVEDKELDRAARSAQQLALAIFYLENGLNDPAESLVRDMRDRYPTLHGDISRLLPF